MNETLRLYPVVPFNVRLALHDTTLPRGGGPDGMGPVGILKDTPIGYSTLVMQRRADLYPEAWSKFSEKGPNGLDPLNFNPDRWANWQPKPWTHIPFNGGPRICIGQQFALTEMGYTIVRMLQRFDKLDSLGENGCAERGEVGGVRVGGPGGPVLKAEIVLQPGMGVWVGFWDKGVDGNQRGVAEKKEKVLIEV
jgi:hypothetical protein